MITNVPKYVVRQLFENNGYKVLFLKEVWASINDPTLRPECFLNNINNNQGPIYGGAWRTVLLKQDVLKSPDEPYIFATFYDLKVECSSANDKESLENIWFNFSNDLFQSAPKKFITKHYNLVKFCSKNATDVIDLKDAATREKFLEKNLELFQPSLTEKANTQRVVYVGIQKPSCFDPDKSYKAQQDIKAIIKEAEQNKLNNNKVGKAYE